jgi:hypothetical protein
MHQPQFPCYDKIAWARIHLVLRPLLIRAIVAQDWEWVDRIWAKGKWMVLRAVQGKEV